ncbi:MAG: SRPBCC domain-containing protein [Bacteroidota bacterium]
MYIKTSIDIPAPKAMVWKHLMDFDRYPEWNSFLQIKGVPKVGAQLENTIFLEGQPPQVFRPKVLEVKTEQSFRWLGHLWIPGLFDGEHYFELKALSEDHTHLVHGEKFKGLLRRPILWMIKSATIRGFEQMNEGLKQQVLEKA